ncbi:MAG: hypothetical protein ACRDIB_12350, partial [Ardenticatenaceae bacterium]
VRLLAVRDLAFPPWVDGVRHGLITVMMAAAGEVITTYEPWLPVDYFPYHFGFHTISATLFMMTGAALPSTLLVLGQLLNALVPLSVYAAAWLMTQRRSVGLVAAFLVAFPFFFPGYYATWGRYTQLMGMLVMPPLVALTWKLLRGGRRWRHTWWIVGVLAAGLFLIHLRVFLYYLPFAALVWVAGRFRRWRALGATAGLALLLVGLRAWQLVPRASPGELLTTTIENYNTFPIGYLTTGWERLFVGMALFGALVSLGAWITGRRWAELPVTLASWVGLLFLLLAGRLIGLPESWLVNLNSMYIILFFPISLLIAIPLREILDFTRTLRFTFYVLRFTFYIERWTLRVLGSVGVGVVGTAMLLFGIHHQIGILNSQTILAYPRDLAALEWVKSNLPADARIGVSAWRWLGNTWSATDGGAWLLPLTGRASTTPPADYAYSVALVQSVNTFNEAASAVEDWSDPAVAEWLRTQRVTHLFVGAKGGFLDPTELARNPALELLYEQDGLFVFAVPPISQR